MIGVYKITSPSGKVYIGQSWNIRRRIRDHKRLVGRGQRRLACSIKSYGVDAHIFEVIFELPKDTKQKTLDKLEQFYMDEYRKSGIKLLNLKEGGNGYGKHCEETIVIIRQKRAKQAPLSVESEKKRSDSLKKVVHTKEWNEKVGKANKGKKLPLWQILLSRKEVIQLSLEDVELKTWGSLTAAAAELKTTPSNICNALTGRSMSAKGFKWKYKTNGL